MKMFAHRLGFKFLIVFPVTVASALAGGKEAGNGGYGYVCYGKTEPNGLREILSAEPLDYFEARHGATWNIDLGPDHAGIDDVDAMVEVGIQRAESITPGISEKMRALYPVLKAEIFDLRGANPAKTKDAHLRVDSERTNCEIAQIAYQLQNPGPKEKRFVYYRRAWDQMSDLAKAGLHLHELVYFTELAAKAEDSDATREYVRLISSSDLQTLAWKDTLKVLRGLKQTFEVRRNGQVGSLRIDDGISGKTAEELKVDESLGGVKVYGGLDAGAEVVSNAESRITSATGHSSYFRIGTDEFRDANVAIHFYGVQSTIHVTLPRPPKSVRIGGATLQSPPIGAFSFRYSFAERTVHIQKTFFAADEDRFRLGNGAILDLVPKVRASISNLSLYFSGDVAALRLNPTRRAGKSTGFAVRTHEGKLYVPKPQLQHEFEFDAEGELTFVRSKASGDGNDRTRFYYHRPKTSP